MSRKTASKIMLLLLLTSMLTMAFNIPPVRAGGTIYIRADGSVDPSTAPISSIDNITYTLTGNISDQIWVERSNIVFDGNNYTVEGSGSGIGFTLKAINNVTIKKTTIKNFTQGLLVYDGSYSNSILGNTITANNGSGISLDHSSSNILAGNNITANNGFGVDLYRSSSNNLTANIITNNLWGIDLWVSSNNTLTGNTITANKYDGIILYTYSSNNTLIGNTIAANNFGIILDSASSNTFSGNNITANSFDGLWLESSSSNTLTGNTITANGIDGLFIIGSSSNTFTGNTITNSGNGLWLVSSSSNTLTGNNITANNFYGIILDYSSSNTFTGNTIAANIWAGIWLDDSSSSNTFTGNTITNNGAGIALESSSGNTISGNSITENYYGLHLEASDHNSISGNSFLSDGLRVYNSYQNVVNDNLVNGKPLVYLEDVSNITVESAGQVILVNCTNMRLENLDLTNTGPGVELIGTNDTVITGSNVTNNSRGIELYNSSNNTLTGNNITANNEDGIFLASSSNNTLAGNNITANNWDGIHLESSSSNTLTGNTITANNGFGIFLAGSSSNALTGNNITNNGYGIYLHTSYNLQSSNNSVSGNNITDNGYGIYLDASDNKIYHNNFINNNIQAFSTIDYNMWDAGYLFGGNYWNDYTGTDLNNDGVGDIPYIIDTYNFDRYPLMHPWSSLPVHNTNTGLGYTRIQEAINAPETLDGHTIFVEVGTYYEHVVVNKTISLIGEDMYNSIIDGNDTGAVVTITSDNVKLSGFQIQHSGWGFSGLRLENSNNNTLNENVIRNCSDGIHLRNSNFNHICENTIANCTANGIYLSYSFNNIIYHNNILNNTNQAYVTTGYPNTWDNESEGNFWSDYVGWDSNGDGVGDVPYIINESNQDNYPLMSPSWYWRKPILGDINKDMKVDGRDIAAAARAFASYPTHPRWNQIADLNHDNKVDGKDIALVAKNFGKIYP